jgi:transcription elongation factor Elf1
VSSFSVDIPVVCGTCGADLDAELNRYTVLEVSACSRCVEEAKKRGHKGGYRQAENDAEAEQAGGGQ